MLTQFANDADRSQMVTITSRDIVFDCPHCHGELVVDQDGAGMTLSCSHCGRSVMVPGQFSIEAAELPPALEIVTAVEPAVPPAPAPAPAAPPAAPPVSHTFKFDGQPPEQIRKRGEELKQQLKENQSQTTEMRGHVNRVTIELHRLQLKLKKLQDRQNAIEAELVAAGAALS